jgi:hypothetical protein
VTLLSTPPWSRSIARVALAGAVATTAAVVTGASGSNVGSGKKGIALMVFGNPSFVSKEMPKQIIHGERFEMGSYRGHKGVIFGT